MCIRDSSQSPPESVPDAISPGLDTRGVRLPAGAVVDVLFDGRRIWSIDPTFHAKDDEGLGLVAWPQALRPYLDGVTQVTVRDHVSHEILLDEELSFGSSRERVRVADSSGDPLAFDKWGNLVQPFDSADDGAITAALEQTAEVLDALRQECGLPAFITYGTLLGAIRDGELIGHDNDIDVAYLSAHDHPVDIARESFQIQHQLSRGCLLYTSPSPRDRTRSRMPSSA